MTLDEIGIRHQTDKASQFTRTYARPHDYLRHLGPILETIRDSGITLVEIGVGGGESIKMFLEYFTLAHIVGVDIVKDTNPYNTEGSGIHPRYIFKHGDQGSESFWKDLTDKIGPSMAVVVDDGSHYAKDIITTFNCIWPHLRSGGVYVIEDLNTAYGGHPFTTPGQPTQMDFIKDMLDQINRGESQIDEMRYSKELCILRKR